MKRLSWSVAAVLAVLGGTLLTGGGTAYASHVNIRVDVPTDAVAGQPAQLRAHLTSESGQPVSGATVVFYTQGTFLGVTGDEEIARAVTDANGLAVATYEPRSPGQHDIRVDYGLPGDVALEHATTTLATADAPGQLVRQTAGVQVPGLNSWLIIAVVSVIWTILFGVGLTLIRIAAAGRSPAPVRQPVAAAAPHQREPVEAGATR